MAVFVGSLAMTNGRYSQELEDEDHESKVEHRDSEPDTKGPETGARAWPYFQKRTISKCE